MRVSIISFTIKGDMLNKRLAELFSEAEIHQTGHGFSEKKITLREWTEEAFISSEAIVFIGAAGIAVRAIAPFLKGKDKDPAVIVIDELGSFVIPILSGHIGGANSLARKIAGFIGGQAVITTATDINGVWAADEWAASNGYSVYNTEEIKHISGAMLRGEKVGIISQFPVCGDLPDGTEFRGGGKYGILIADKPEQPFEHTLVLIPRRITVGAGSRSGASPDKLLSLYISAKERLGFEDCAVECVSTIDIKKGEKSIEELAKYIGCGLRYYSAQELNKAKGSFSGSAFVKSVTGVDNVCERAAVMRGGRIIAQKTVGNGVTIALAARKHTVIF